MTSSNPNDTPEPVAPPNTAPQPEVTPETTAAPSTIQPELTSETTATSNAAPQPEVPVSEAPNTFNSQSGKKPKSAKKWAFIAVIAVVILGAGVIAAIMLNHHSGQNTDRSEDRTDISQDQPEQDTPMSGSTQISDFDLAFLDRDNVSNNQLYSPLSIKYALGMLEAGAAGDSKEQIKNAIGNFNIPKYPTNQNMSLANALFTNDKLPADGIKSTYIDSISKQFGAEALRVPFATAAPINNWVGDKTFNLINNLLQDDDLNTAETFFVLVNALAIDMEWVNKIQPYDELYSISLPHINYGATLFPFRSTDFTRQAFNNSTLDVNSLPVAATVHRYDILNDLGVDKIRQTVTDEYTKWLNDEEGGIYCAKYADEPFPTPEVYIEKYMEELGNGGYETVKSSTDFSLYDDEEIKVFAKDLRTYDGVTLQYVGIMPKAESLQAYVNDLKSEDLVQTIAKLKPIALDSFRDGVITDIRGNIPVFKFEDKLKLIPALEGIGITDVFSEQKANLSNLVKDPEGVFIGAAIHQTTIDFSNDGIKASAATALAGGLGAGGCSFSYDFDVPVEKIDLTFDNPFLFLIRDKDSGTIWFVGTVYEPTPYQLAGTGM